jgi:hypothetical protein
VTDRCGVHMNIGMFFSQFETVSDAELMRRLFERTMVVEEDLETVFRGDPRYTVDQRRAKLEAFLRTFRLPSLGLDIMNVHADNPEICLKAVELVRDLLEIVEVFTSMHDRFSLRDYILQFYSFVSHPSNQIDPTGRPYQHVVVRLNELLRADVPAPTPLRIVSHPRACLPLCSCAFKPARSMPPGVGT